MTNDLRGSGLGRADAALAALVEHPERLNRDRNRFDDSPPPYRSHDSTASQPTPRDTTDEQDRLEARVFELVEDRTATFPSHLFKTQVHEEIYRHISKDALPADELYNYAKNEIRTRWSAQGIWDEDWKERVGTKWRHEKPLEPEADEDTNEDSPVRFSFTPPPPKSMEQRKKERPSEECLQFRHAARVQAHEATRPFQQFVRQVSIEREKILRDPAAIPEGTPAEDSPEMSIPDVNTTAYERVKTRWETWKIWDRRWGVLPGMTWKHEQYFDDFVRQDMGEEKFALLPKDALKGLGHLRPAAVNGQSRPPASGREGQAGQAGPSGTQNARDLATEQRRRFYFQSFAGPPVTQDGGHLLARRLAMFQGMQQPFQAGPSGAQNAGLGLAPEPRRAVLEQHGPPPAPVSAHHQPAAIASSHAHPPSRSQRARRSQGSSHGHGRRGGPAPVGEQQNSAEEAALSAVAQTPPAVAPEPAAAVEPPDVVQEPPAPVPAAAPLPPARAGRPPKVTKTRRPNGRAPKASAESRKAKRAAAALEELEGEAEKEATPSPPDQEDGEPGPSPPRRSSRLAAKEQPAAAAGAVVKRAKGRAKRQETGAQAAPSVQPKGVSKPKAKGRPKRGR